MRRDTTDIIHEIISVAIACNSDRKNLSEATMIASMHNVGKRIGRFSSVSESQMMPVARKQPSSIRFLWSAGSPMKQQVRRQSSEPPLPLNFLLLLFPCSMSGQSMLHTLQRGCHLHYAPRYQLPAMTVDT
mmetsp:Transcript_1466/g.3670  ORF Transcript_1466/g.3670 Transcript_1466/m.3670 type:complete len:131 (+) Transcript_1466:263-655(+)